jgi:hypothetical protein
VSDKAKALFSVAMQTEIEDETNTLFCSDHWLHGQRIVDIIPRLLATVPKRRINNHTVHEALTRGKCISDIQGALIVGVITEFLHLWYMILNFELQQGVNGNRFWRLATNKHYSAKVAYERFFLGIYNL